MRSNVRRIDTQPAARLLRHVWLAAASAIALSACTSVVPQPAPNTYDITAPHEIAGLSGRTGAQLLILEPTALKVLDSEQIVVKPSDSEVEYLGRAQWSDRLPKLLQARLVETFENTGRARAVARPGEGLVIDYQIVTDIRAFEASIGGGNVARVALSVKLVSDRTGRVVRTRIFSSDVPLSGTDGLSVATGLDAAFDRIAAEIVKWTFAAV